MGRKMNREIYRKVAREHGVTVKEVKDGMQKAIDATYVNPTFQGKSVKRKGEKPTPDELINDIASKILDKR